MKEYSIVSSIPSCVWANGVSINDRIDSMYYRSSSIKDYEKIKKFSKIKRISDYFDVSKLSGFEYTDYFTEENLKRGTVIALTSQNIMENQINFDNIIKIPFEIHNSLERSKIYPNDVLLSYTGQYRRACTAPQNMELHLGPNICRLRLKSSKLIDVHYVSTFLNCRYGQSSLDREKTLSAQPTVNMSRIRDIFLPIPSPEIQRYIGDKVRKAEELREEAKRLKKEAEEIINDSLNFRQLDLLYKGSKVKFKWISTNVLTDRIDGNYYEQKYVETINHIKRNSKKYITLNSIIDSIYTGKKPMYDEKGTEAYFVQSGNISSNFLEIDNKEKVDLSKYNQVLFGDLLIAKDGETIGKIAINLTNEIIIINEHTYCVRLKEKYKYYSAYIYYLLINDYINPLIRREATGSAQKGLNFSFAENIIIPILEEDIIINLYNLELRRCNNIYKSKQLVQEAKQDVEDLIEGNFDMSKVKANN